MYRKSTLNCQISTESIRRDVISEHNTITEDVTKNQDDDASDAVIESSITPKCSTPSIAESKAEVTTWTTTFGKDKLETTVHLVQQGKASKSDLVRNISGPQSNSECHFKRGGLCEVHKIQGKRRFTISRKWEKLKSGTYGNVYSKKTIWSSECQKTLARKSAIYPHHSDISSSKRLSVKSGGLYLDQLSESGEHKVKVSRKRNLNEQPISHRLVVLIINFL